MYHQLHRFLSLIITIVFTFTVSHAQSFKIVKTKAVLVESIQQNTHKKFVALKDFIPDIKIEMAYATTNNFCKSVLYEHPIAMLRIEPAAALKHAQEELSKSGLGLKVFDAYRPYNITCKMWRLTPDRHYVANPSKGSNHNRGIAVDLTLVVLKTGKELDMGCRFDCFADSSNHSFTKISNQAIRNRKLLKETMKKIGFRPLQNEWWHYSWANDIDYEVVDMDFEAIMK